MVERKFKSVCISGYFDPIHIGHIEYIKNAKLLGDKLIVILNREYQHKLKKFRHSDEERKTILESLKYVDEVFLSIDSDQSVCLSLQSLKPTIFAKGMQPSQEEQEICKQNNIEVVTDVGKQIYFQDLLYQFR